MKLAKKLISFASVCAIMVGMLATQVSAALYLEVSNDDLAALATSENAGHLQRAGAPVFSYAEGKGLTVSGRTADWNAVDFTLADLPAGKYTLEVTFHSAGDDVFQIVDADGPYATHVESEKGTDATISHEFEVDGSGMSGTQNRWRLRTGNTNDYTIVAVKLYDEGGVETATAPVATAEGSESPTTGNAPVAIVLAVMAIAGTTAVAVKSKKNSK